MTKYRLKEARIVLREGSGLTSSELINCPEDAVRQCAEFMRHLDRENVVAVNLDIKKRPINYTIVSIGTLNTSQIDPRNVFKAAILSNAAAIILLHNHPSGDTTPSQEDISVTEKLIHAGNLLSIYILDHIIVGADNGTTHSMREYNEASF